MMNEEKFRKALIEGRNFRGNMIKISEVMDVCDFIDPHDLVVFIEDDGFKIVNFRLRISNMAIDNAKFSILDYIKGKVKIGILKYKKKKNIQLLAILADGHIHIMEDEHDCTEITFILKVKPI